MLSLPSFSLSSGVIFGLFGLTLSGGYSPPSSGCAYGSWTMPASSCRQLKEMNGGVPNGLYYLQDFEGSHFSAYCDMVTAGGGWTLVASVHENSLEGRCTSGDRWSGQQGNNEDHPHGDGNWENRATYGRPESATSGDYKNPAYFTLGAKDIMVWHVPNDTPMVQYELRAFMKYHTYSGFLSRYGGNLQTLFRDHFPLRDDEYEPTFDNGPAVEIMWDRGSNEMMTNHTPPKLREGHETEPGYVHFRVINKEKSAFAMCPGLKMKPNIKSKKNGMNAEHVCIGGTSYHEGHKGTQNYCGDFAAKDWNGYASGVGYSSNRAMTESVVLIFYR